VEFFVKRIMKKIMIYSMVGIMQLGLGATVIEASPLHNDGPYMEQQDNRHDHERHERERIENERHEREMRRHHHESEWEWHERQKREQQRHDNTMNEIAAGLIGILIGSAIN
jgi:ABC-type Zn2+ transport system substrate-binding protein/surface adhesin